MICLMFMFKYSRWVPQIQILIFRMLHNNIMLMFADAHHDFELGLPVMPQPRLTGLISHSISFF